MTKFRSVRRTKYVGRTGAMRSAHKILVGNPKYKRLHGRYERNIQINLKEIGFESVEWIKVALGSVQW
jgi:hypothetical protein